jgi:ABC-type transport system substrate-binding protein
MKKFVWFGIALLMVASLVMTSCGSAEEEEQVPSGQQEENDDTPKYGGKITYIDHSAGIPATWDPNMDNFGTAGLLGGCLYEKLLAVDYSKGRTGTQKYEYVVRWKPEEVFVDGAGLAESWEFETPTKLIMHLRENVYWPAKPEIGLAEKRQFVADDVVFVYETALENARTSEILKKLLNPVGKLDGQSVEFDLNYFHRDWTNDLSTQFRMIYSPEAYAAGTKDGETSTEPVRSRSTTR